MFSWFKKSLGRKIVATLIVVAAGPALVGFHLAYRGAYAAWDETFGAMWETWVADDVARLNRAIAARVEQVEAIAREREMAEWFDDRASPAPPPGLPPAFASEAACHLAFFDASGEPRWSSAGFPKSVRPPRPSAVGASGSGAASGSERLAAEWEAIHAERDGEILLALLAPLRDAAGEPLGFAALAFDFARLREEIRSCSVDETALVYAPGGAALGGLEAWKAEQLSDLLAERFEDRGSATTISGRFLANAPACGHERAAIVFRSLRAGNTPGVEGSGWRLVTAANYGPVSAARSKFFWDSTLAGLLSLSLVLLVGAYLASLITRPLRALREDARAFAAGNLDARAVVGTSDELAELAADFNAMARRLSETYKNLERSIEQAEQRARELEVIAQITTAMTSALTIDQTFAKFSERLGQLSPYELCVLSIMDADGWLSHIVAEGSEEREPPFSDDEVRAAINDERPRLYDAAEMASRAGGRLRSGAVLPLATKTKTIGGLLLASSRHGAIDAEMLGNLSLMAEGLAAAVYHSYLYEQYRDFAESLERQVESRTRELRQAHDQLLQVEKFAATGKLAANLAHEINNPLGIIRNHLQLIKERHRAKTIVGQSVEPAPEEKWIAIIQEEIERIARLTRSLLKFYRSSPGEADMISINREVEGIVFLMREACHRKGIEIVFKADPMAPEIWLSADLARQVFMNLLRNAEDAMEAKPGTIEVALKLRAEMSQAFPHGYIEATVRDAGKGIPAENLSQIFDPFFTTKGAEKGTGLGLSVTYGIMTNIKGSIEVESELGVGTTFRLKFPITRPPSKPGGSASRPHDPNATRA